MKNFTSVLILVLVLAICDLVIAFNIYLDEQENIVDEATIIKQGSKGITVAAKAKVIKAGLFKVIRSGGLVETKNTSTGKAI